MTDYILKNSNTIYTVNNNLTLCPDFLHRVVNTVYCPSIITCSPGYVLCDDNTCRPSSGDCPITKVCDNLTCPNGMCVDDYSKCPSNTVCGKGMRLCSDRQCHSRLESCPSYPDDVNWNSLKIGKKVCRGGGIVELNQFCPNHVHNERIVLYRLYVHWTK